MGFESYQVVLTRGNRSIDEIERDLHARGCIHPDPDGGLTDGDRTYRWADDAHVLELEFEEPDRLSLRFALCHPPSADRLLAAVLAELIPAYGFHHALPDEGFGDRAGVGGPPSNGAYSRPSQRGVMNGRGSSDRGLWPFRSGTCSRR